MTTPQQLAKHLHSVFFGGNWTDVHLRQVIKDVELETATTRVRNLHTIAELVFHIDYFIRAVQRVLRSEDINANDKLSFDLPELRSQEEWEALCESVFTNAASVVDLANLLPPEKMSEHFVMEKYGSYHYNLAGLTEHTHYHLGQISLLKKYLNA